VFWHSGIPFSVLSTPYSANGNGIVNGSGPQFASVVPGVPLYGHRPIPGVTQPGTIQWLNPDAFVSTVDPSTGACFGGDSLRNCQFENLGRNALRGPNFTWSDFYITKWFPLTERVKMRFDTQFFNVFNHPNFGLPSMVLAGIPGKPSTQTGFGAFTYTTSPPTGLLGVGLGGDSTPRMIAFQLRLEFEHSDPEMLTCLARVLSRGSSGPLQPKLFRSNWLQRRRACWWMCCHEFDIGVLAPVAISVEIIFGKRRLEIGKGPKQKGDYEKRQQNLCRAS
jgi:hypothetical protein